MKLSKLLLGSAIALPATITPLSALTSCAQSWGHLSAMSIGGVFNSDGPYSSCMTTNPLDYDGKPYAEYLQSNYTIKQSSNTPYAYSMPMEWDKEEGEHGDWVNGTNGWYGIGSSAFKSTATYTDAEGKKQTSTNARNAALSSNISFISGIGLTLSNYLTQSLKYQSSQIDVDDEESVQCAWGTGVKGATQQITFKYGKDTKPSHPGDQLFDFYEFGFANANLNGAKKSSAMLRPSNISFTFNKFPLPSYKFDGTNRVDLSNEFLNLIDPDVNPASYSVEDFTYYASCKKDLKDKDEDEYWTFRFDAVPIIVKINSITESYLDPRKSSSFLVNDYYSNDGQVLSTIGSQWKTPMKKLTGCESAEAIPQNKSFKLETNTGIHFDFPTGDVDKRLNYETDAFGTNFIALASYNVSIYKDSTKRNKNVAAMNGITSMLPAYWLDIYKYRTDLFKRVRGNDETSPFIFNQKTINNIASKFRGLIERTSSEGRKRAKNTSQESKNLLGFLSYVFGTTSGVADTSVFLTPTDPIEHD